MKIKVRPAPEPPSGFRFAGVHAGFKKNKRRDFAMIVADEPVVVAAAFTKNRAAAAPVQVARANCADQVAQAVLVNSGNANAATGKGGLELAKWSCAQAARRLGIKPELVVPCSTGVIGVPISKAVMSRAISAGVSGLSARSFEAAARAIMTSDAFPKWSERTVSTRGGDVRIVGMAKGAGMIQPDMATLISVILTDAPLSSGAARALLKRGLAGSFNRINVDGDTSTNDTTILMASGTAPVRRLTGPRSEGYEDFAVAVTEVMDEMSRMMVRDGEGAGKVVDIEVSGAASDRQAETAARAIANSVLFRCALAGADPNWGRIVMALGNTKIEFDLGQLVVEVGGVTVARRGAVVSARAVAKAADAMKASEFVVRVGVGRGPGRFTVVTSDLTEEYVHFNSAYTS